MGNVVVLNASYEVLNVVSVHRAVRYVLKRKAEVLRADSERLVRAASHVMPAPLVVRLLRYVRVPYRAGAPCWSRKGVLRRDGHRCAYCAGRASTVDHVVPRSRGGADSWANTVASCGSCNNRKGSRTPVEAGMTLRVTPYAPRLQTLGEALVWTLDLGPVS